MEHSRKISVLVVCTGNICRSPAVERLLAARLGAAFRGRVAVGSLMPAIEIGSAGTGAGCRYSACIVRMQSTGWREPGATRGGDRTVDVHLSWLRRKLGETAAAPRFIHSVRGVGIKLAVDG